MMEYINGWEWLPLVLFTIAGFIMVSFSTRGDIAFMGTVMIVMTMLLAHETHSNNLAKEYVQKRFMQGQALKCGLWKGESILVDQKSGWKFEENIGFIKGDHIQNDQGLCTVIGEESPKAPEIPYGFALIFELMLAFGLRAAYTKYVIDEEEKNYDNE